MTEQTTRGLILIGCALALLLLRWNFQRHLASYIERPDAEDEIINNLNVVSIMCAIFSIAAVLIGSFFLMRGQGWI